MVTTIKRFDKPCGNCGGTTFYYKSMKCLKCVRMKTAQKIRDHVEARGGVIVDSMVRNNNSLEAKVMKNVWYG